jgi:hypothetical protein
VVGVGVVGAEEQLGQLGGIDAFGLGVRVHCSERRWREDTAEVPQHRVDDHRTMIAPGDGRAAGRAAREVP